jgi:predicted outer membrane repeat protein
MYHTALLLKRSMKLIGAIGLALISIGLVIAPHAAARSIPSGPPVVATRYVATSGLDSGDCSNNLLPCATVQYAIDQSINGNSILIAGGFYSGTTPRAGNNQLAYISTTLTIRGGYTTTDNFASSNPDVNPTILDAAHNGRVLRFVGADGDVSNLTAQNGYMADTGAGIESLQALTLTNVSVLSNTLYQASNVYGGGVYVEDAAVIIGGVIQNNLNTDSSAGGLYANSTLVVSGTRFISNTTGFGAGGGLRVVGPAVINHAVFEANHAFSSSGGGVYAEGQLAVLNSVFISNTTNRTGGGVYADSSVSLTNSQFISNAATLGTGGGVNAAGDALVTGGLFDQNFSSSGGGGLYVVNTLWLSGTQFLNNSSAGSGGGLNGQGAITLINGLFQNNSSPNGTAGGLTAGSSLVLTGTSFLSNTSKFNGGGAWIRNLAVFNGGLFQNNRSLSNGGGAYVQLTVNLTGTQFINNTASLGGGLYKEFTDSRIVNAIFARNTVTGTHGSAFYSHGGSDLLVQTTIATPTLDNGSAIYVFSSTLNLTDTIIDNYALGLDLRQGTLSEDYNLFSYVLKSYSGTLVHGGHSIVGAALFVNPNAGNYQLQFASAARDNGINAGVSIDRAGNARPSNGFFEIGAYEYQGVVLRLYLPLMLKNF